MKAKLTFDLPEETVEFNHAVNGHKYSMRISEFDELLRSRLKYDNNPEWDYETVDSIRTKFWEIMGDITEL